MSNENQGVIHSASEGGVIGKHPDSSPFQFLVGPATGTEVNTIRDPPTAILCWKVEDIRFAFDSSFVTCNPDNSPDPLTNPDDQTSDPTAIPFAKGDIRDELKLLASQIKLNPGCPLSVFGHADPVGPAVDPDGYNKALSGRRATAIYALLISGTQPAKAASLWQGIASNPNEHWGTNQAQIMQQLTGLPDGTSMSTLISSYIPKLVPPEFLALQIGPANFLAQGADSQGKGDYQGCSSFNPLLIFSQQKADSFAPGADDKDPAVFAARNLANAPNRRVMVLIFNKGSKVDPNKWPCPSASGDKSGCIKRFWSDGQTRRSTRLPDEDRKYAKTKDTFACRFYDRLMRDSPCYQSFEFVQIHLYDAFGKAIPFAPFATALGDQQTFTPQRKADNQGLITVAVPADEALATSVRIKWGFEPEKDQEPVLLFSKTIFLISADEPRDQAGVKKLSNLGYDSDDQSRNVLGFQLDYGPLADPFLAQTGELDEPTLNLLDNIYEQSATDLRETKVGTAASGAK